MKNNCRFIVGWGLENGFFYFPTAKAQAHLILRIGPISGIIVNQALKTAAQFYTDDFVMVVVG